MTSNNIDDSRKKQKKTEVADRVDQDSSNDSLSLLLLLSAPVVVIVPSALFFGNVLHAFPDLLSCVLPYIADRVIWNSIAGSNKDMYEKSKTILPPWPAYYKLPVNDCWSWSPCGTRIACSFQSNNLEIFDQRHGPLHRWRATFDDVFRYPINDLKYSPDGRYIVSTGDDDLVRLWDTVTGNYEQLQEWDAREEVGFGRQMGDSKVSVSACSKYIAVSVGTGTVLKDVENGNTINLLFAPLDEKSRVTKTVFSSDGRAICICCNRMLQIWYPYLDDDDDDRLVTLWRQPDNIRDYAKYTFSHDNKMVAIYSNNQRGTIWSIDIDRNRLTHKSDFLDFLGRNYVGVYFTPDDRYIVYDTKNGPTFRITAANESTDSTIHVLDQRYNDKRNLVVKGFSPTNRQLIIVQDTRKWDNPYITSYFMK